MTRAGKIILKIAKTIDTNKINGILCIFSTQNIFTKTKITETVLSTLLLVVLTADDVNG